MPISKKIFGAPLKFTGAWFSLEFFYIVFKDHQQVRLAFQGSGGGTLSTRAPEH